MAVLEPEPTCRVGIDENGGLVRYDPAVHEYYHVVPVSMLWKFQWHVKQVDELKSEVRKWPRQKSK